jgi:glycosyltransferase involved in cell wall biosynthesis
MTRDDSVAFFAELDREALLDRDALFFLAASFPAKLATVRPYGVMVLDMVPFQLADQLSEGTRTLCQAALRPTLEGAEVLVATSEATRALVREYCMIDEDRVVLAPLGCETYRRLSAIHPAAIPGLERPFLLNITNFSPHKGAATVVRAYALLQRRLGDSCPALVFAGCMTETFAPAPAPPPTGYVGEVRDLIAASGLVPGRDVFCLGLISDEQTAWLYRNCRAVLNAAVTDNGTYCLIEGRYFGRPVVTSDYPAARWLCERFGVPARTFAAGDAAALCEEMHASLSDPILAGDELVREQRRLEGEEFSRERFVERLYDHLLELAKNGRRQRQCESLRLSETQQRAVVRMAAMEEAPCS